MPTPLGARGSTHAMYVILRDVWEIVIHHMCNIDYINTACRDIRRDQHAEGATLESLERRHTLAERTIRMQYRHRESALLERARDAIRAVLRAREHNGRTRLFLEEPKEE